MEGETLKEHLEKAAVPIEETLRICRQIADAVSAAHERGIIHRDLKPANIMITADDTIKVLDFGIAKALDPSGTGLAQEATLSAAHRTAAGTMVGTPTYMSPEQARGKPIDKRSDIWSFGCVLFECLTGQTAFGGETVTDTLAKVLERDPDYTRVPDTTPLAVQMVLRRCLQKDRKKRLSPVKRAFQQGLTVSADGRWLSVAAWKAEELPRIWLYDIHTGLIRPLTPADEVCFQAKFSHDGRHVSYLRWDWKKSAIMIASTDGVEEAKEALSFDPSSGWTWVNCWTHDDRAIFITKYKGEENDSDILRLDLDSGQTTPVIASTAREYDLRLSPDGKLFLYESNVTGEFHIHMRAYDAASGTVGPSMQVTTETGASSASWSPDGGQIYFVDERDHLQSVKVTSDPKLSVSPPETVLDVGELRAVGDEIVPLP